MLRGAPHEPERFGDRTRGVAEEQGPHALGLLELLGQRGRVDRIGRGVEGVEYVLDGFRVRLVTVGERRRMQPLENG